MNRLERYRQIRAWKRKFFFSFLMFFILLSAGITLADYSTNRLMHNENRMSLVAFHNRGSYLEVSLMNQKVYVDIQKLHGDLDGLLERFRLLLGGR